MKVAGKSTKISYISPIPIVKDLEYFDGFHIFKDPSVKLAWPKLYLIYKRLLFVEVDN